MKIILIISRQLKKKEQEKRIMLLFVSNVESQFEENSFAFVRARSLVPLIRILRIRTLEGRGWIFHSSKDL